MLIDPSGKIMGMDAMLPFFQKMPLADVLFQNFVFSGISLLIVNGLTNLTAAVLLLRRKHAGVVLGGFFGITADVVDLHSILAVSAECDVDPVFLFRAGAGLDRLRGMGV